MSSSRPRVAVLGNSYAAYCQIPALLWANEADVVAVVGRDLAKARATAERFQIPLATTSVDEALATRPDLVIVSTPVDLHFAMVERALTTTSAAVLCEKPFTLSVDEARRLTELARTARSPSGGARLALVDHQLRWSAPRRAFRELVVGGAVGTPWVARSEMCFGSMERLTRPWSWWDERERGGGALQAIGSHLVDGLLWILGPVVDVQARLTTCTKTRRDAPSGVERAVTADDHAELWLTHASGARSSMLCTTVHVHGRRSLLEVIGARGVVRLVDEHELFVGRHDGALERVDVKLPAIEDVNACNDSAFARCEPLFLRDVVRAVATGSTSLPHAATFDDGLACVQVLTAVLTAAR